MSHMKSYLLILAPLALGAGSAPALAQGYPYPQYQVQPLPLQWFIDGGPSFTLGRTADYLDNGWTVGGGFELRPQPGQPFTLRTELDYSRFGATSQLLSEGEEANQTQIDGGYGEAVDAQVDGVLEEPLNPWTRLYLMGGIGVAYRRIELTQSGSSPCDPFLGVCGPGLGSVSSTNVASYDTTRFAWNVGAGLDFPLPAGQSWFVEARYERIETPEPTEFLPLRVGIRF